MNVNNTVRYAGEVDSFIPEPFLLAAEILMQADEAELALNVLRSVPARYRDAPPKEIGAMREQILASLVTPHAYMSVDLDCSVENVKGISQFSVLPRAHKVRALVNEINEKDLVPHIIDMGPGEYWLPIGLQSIGARFTYHDVSMLGRTAQQARGIVAGDFFRERPGEGQPIIFCAFELIEHLPSIQDIAIEALRHGGRMPDYAFLSTPLYTFDGRAKDWRKPCGQPHLRAYTPTEFQAAGLSLFPGYLGEMLVSDIMIWAGRKND